MAETYKLKHPSGTEVEVTSAARRDVLLSRGYTAVGASRKKTTRKATRRRKTTAARTSTVTTSEGTKKQGGK